MNYSLLFIGACISTVASAHEVMQRVGGYSSESGESRSSGAIGGTINQRPLFDGFLSSGTYGIEAGAERIAIQDLKSDDYMSEQFPDGYRLNRTASLSTTQTIRKLTDLRLGGSWMSDTVTHTRTVNGGVGQWWFHDTIQTNLDVSRTETNRPADSILDYDRETVYLGPLVSSGGVTLSVKHLATPTTIWGPSWTRVEASDRPRLDAYGVNVRQFIPKWSAALHANVARIINTGDVDTNTTSGSLAGVQSEWAVLKTLWEGGAGRVAYRFVREDEQTRSYGDHLVYGADSYSAGLTQEFKKGVLADRPVIAHAVAVRYLSNRGGATLGEAGLAMKF